MRRAAGATTEGVQVTDTAAVGGEPEPQDALTLSRTAYPLELPPQRKRREAHPPQEAERSTDQARRAKGDASLLERLDPRLAQKVVADSRLMPVSREQYRRLAASLHHSQSANGTKLVMIASAVPGEGKTLTATNLALTFSESYQRSVLLIDGDLRKPGLHSIFGLDNTFGLSDGLASKGERKLPVHPVTPLLSVLPAGRPNPDPMAGLTSERMRRILDEAREGFDWVIIDTPPVGLLSDANLLSHMVDAALVVVKAGSTPFELVQRAVEAIGRDRVIGTVLNRADPTANDSAYGYYGSYYHAQADQA